MTWFKFLTEDAVGMFSGFRWPRPDPTRPGDWVYAAGALDLCRNGLHACRPADLPYWLQEELYVVDLDEPVIELERLVLARRGRLRARVTAWHRESALEFSKVCALRVRDWAADALARSGRPEHADALLACRVEDLPGAATGIVEGAGDLGSSLVGYTADAAHYATLVKTGNGWAAAAATTGFIAATAAGAAAGPSDAPSATTTERFRQAGWVADLIRA